MDEVAKMSIKELKAIIHRANLSTVGIFEKDELRQLALEAQARFASDTSDGMPCDNTTHFSSDFNQRSIPIVQQHGTVSQVKTNDCNSERKRLKPGHEINGAKKGRVVIKRWLGSGAFADVYQVETNKVVLKHEAMKVIILKSQNDKLISDAERIRRLRPHVIEAHLMLKLGRHANLVGVNAAFQINEDFYFFQDLVSGGQTLKSTMSLLTIDQAILVAYKIANGLAYMHDTCYFCFWDLNPSQVLVELLGADMNRAVGAVKLSGFGCSGGIGCTWAYASPETRALLVPPKKKDDPYSPRPFRVPSFSESDSVTLATIAGIETEKLSPRLRVAAQSQDQWALAVTIVEMLTGKRVENAHQVSLQLHQDCGNDAIKLALQCLDKEPSKRPAMRDLVKSLGNFLSESVIARVDKVEEVSLSELFHLHSNIGNYFFKKIFISSEDYDLAYEHLSAARDLAEKLYGDNTEHYANSIYNLARLLKDKGLFSEAKLLYERALVIWQDIHGPDHPQVSTGRKYLAKLLRAQGKDDEAKRQYDLAIETQKKCLDPNSQNYTSDLLNLAEMLKDQGYYDKAKALYECALISCEEKFGPNHSKVAKLLNDLAFVLQAQGYYDKAKVHSERALSIRQVQLGPNHPDVAESLNSLALLLITQAKYDEAKQLFTRALKIREEQLGANHPDVAQSLNNLAALLSDQANYDEAEPMYRRALEIDQKIFGSDHPHVAAGLNNLAESMRTQGKYDEVKPNYERAIEIWEKAYGPDHPRVAGGLNNLATLLYEQGQYDEARALHERALKIREEKLGPDHPDVAQSLNNLAGLLRDQGKRLKSKAFYERALRIREENFGPNHPDFVQSLKNLARLLKDEGKYEETRQCFERALRINEATFGPNHPKVAQTLNELAVLLNGQGKYDEAEPMYRRALAIDENNFGPMHVDVACDLNNLALLLKNQNKYKEARSLMQRALDIVVAKFPPQDPKITMVLTALNVIDKQIRNSRKEKNKTGNRKKKRR